MDVSLVIPAHNEEAWVGIALDSVLKNASGKFKEIVVVDNASTDKTAEVAGRFPGVTVIREDRKGTNFARYAGANATTAPIIAFMDADARLRPGWFEMVKTRFEKDPRLAVFTGPYHYYDSSAWRRTFVWVNWHFGMPIHWIAHTGVVGGNFAIRRSILEKMGGFDTSLVFFGDDIDIGRRARKFGKVRFSFKLIMDASSRRFHGQGFFNTLWLYTVNAVEGAFAINPKYTAEHEDFR